LHCGKLGFGLPPSSLAEALAQLPARGKTHKGCGESVDIASRDEQAGLPIRHDLWDDANISQMASDSPMMPSPGLYRPMIAFT
jgi:hypothetical protein